MFRRMLLMAKLSENDSQIILDFSDGILTVNFDGKGNKTTVNGSEVIINE